jgi:hypothetical protein
VGLAVPALSTRPVFHYMADQLKIEGGYHKTPIHQDWRSVQVICGSHRRGLLPNVDDAFGRLGRYMAFHISISPTKGFKTHMSKPA